MPLKHERKSRARSGRRYDAITQKSATYEDEWEHGESVLVSLKYLLRE
jgi:hypothetical protein